MTHAIRFEATGGPEVLKWQDVALATPGAGEVRVRHSAIGLNYIDTYFRRGMYPATLPSGLGSEASGVVEAVGAGVTQLKPGDRVAYGTGPLGAYAEARVMPAAVLLKLPAAIDDRSAAAMMLKGLTARYLLRATFRVERGMTVLFHAAAGGTGGIAVQWLKHLGCVVIATAGDTEKCARAKSLGADHVINYTVENFPARVKEITNGKGVPVVYDGVGKATFEGSLDCLARRGMLVSFGAASGAIPPFAPQVLSSKGSLYLTRPTLGHYCGTRGELEESAADLFDVVASGAVRIDVGQSFALKDAAEAHRALESRATTASTILLP